MVPAIAGVALTSGAAAMGTSDAACRHWAVRAGLQLAGRVDDRDLLRGVSAEHDGELAQLLPRRLRSLRHHHGRQAAGLLVGPGSVDPVVRLPRLVADDPPGCRGSARRAGALPRGAPSGRAAGRSRRVDHPGGQPGHHDARPGQHPRLPHGPAAGPGGRFDGHCHPDRPLAERGHGRHLGRTGLPGQDAGGLADPASSRHRLPRRRARQHRGSHRPLGHDRSGDGRRVPLVHDVRLPHARVATTVRGRQHEQLRVPAGLRLQRLLPGGPGIAQRGARADTRNTLVHPGRAATGVEPAADPELRP